MQGCYYRENSWQLVKLNTLSYYCILTLYGLILFSIVCISHRHSYVILKVKFIFLANSLNMLVATHCLTEETEILSISFFSLSPSRFIWHQSALKPLVQWLCMTSISTFWCSDTTSINVALHGTKHPSKILKVCNFPPLCPATHKTFTSYVTTDLDIGYCLNKCANKLLSEVCLFGKFW